ncbi:hypothetical protein Tco_0559957 [Tanacetum coccineum]
MTDAKELGAIKSRFGGNDESKKMHKYILKQQFEGFSISNSEGLHKGYDRFQSLLTSIEDSWSSVSMRMQNQRFLDLYPIICLVSSFLNMRTKPGKVTVSALMILVLNDVSTAYSVSNPSGQNSQVAMISMRMKKFYKKTGRKLQFDAKEPVGGLKALVTIDGEGVDWTSHSEEEEDYALMACNSSGSDTENSEDEHVFQPKKEQEQPSFASTNKQVKTPRETVKKQFTHSKNSTVKEGLDWVLLPIRAVLYVEVLVHLIRDCDFHGKRMANSLVNNNHENEVLVKREIRPILEKCAKDNRHRQEKYQLNAALKDYPHRALKHKGIVDSGCSRHMTGNKAYLAEYQDFNGGPVAFGGSKGYITGKGKIKIGKLDFEDVCFVKELQQFNLFSVSQICDKKNKVLFTDSECLVLSPEFKLPDENQVLLRIPRQNNMYSFNLENIVPSGVDERKNKTLIEVARTYASRFILPNAFGLKQLSNAGYVLIRRSENQANKHAGPQEANHNAVKRSTAKDAGEAPNKHLDLKTDEKLDANDAAEALRKEFAQETENLLLQAGADKASSTNIVNTVSNDSEIPALKDIYQNPTDGIFTNSTYDDEGVVAEFTNLEPVMNVSPIPTSRINSIHPSTLILGDPRISSSNKRRIVAVQDSESLDSCRFALWEEGNWNKIGIDYDEVFAPVARD